MKKAALLLSALALTAPAQAGWCQIDRLAYAPAEDLEAIDVALIGAARKRIDFAAYAFTDVRIVEALDAAATRGVAIRLYRDASQATIPMPGPLARAYDRLAARRNVEIRYKGDGPFMHLKAYAVDGAVLREGAGNFSHSGLTRQDNSLIVLRCKAAVMRFESAFEAMWRRP
ncbi:phospholipase D-like domain-containing protein [Methylocystis sp. S23]